MPEGEERREELKHWTVDMDVTFRARELDQAVATAHAIAEWLESRGAIVNVTLGENYRKEEIQTHDLSS